MLKTWGQEEGKAASECLGGNKIGGCALISPRRDQDEGQGKEKLTLGARLERALKTPSSRYVMF